jgi:multidrug resistance efflux pump
MATSPVPATISSPASAAAPAVVDRVPSRLKSAWQSYGTSFVVILLAAAVIITIAGNWNGWEGGRIEQVTNDAYVRGDLTPLSTKVPGLVREVKVNDYEPGPQG